LYFVALLRPGSWPVMADTSTSSGGIPLRRSQAVLRQLARNREGCTFSHLRTIEQGLTASSLSRLLKAMQAENMVSKDECTGAYRLHTDFIRLAHEIVGMIPPHERLRPLVAALAQSTRESAAWFECTSTGAVLMAKTEIADRFHYIDEGRAIANPLGHGVGQVLMAFSPESDVCDRLQRLGPPPGAEQDYRRRLEEIRHGRVIIDDINIPGGCPLTRVARPVFRGPGGSLAGVLLVTVWPASSTMQDQERLAEAVTSAASRATEMLKGEIGGR
jgi:DNA-binding IclR family transcriptional regulator